MATMRALSQDAALMKLSNGNEILAPVSEDVVSKVATELCNLSDRVTDQQVMMNPEWMRAACDYARAYKGDFPYMLDMARAMDTHAGLSIPQMRGTLNCLRAESLRKRQQQENAPQAPVTLNAIDDGYYTVVFPDGHVTIRIQTHGNKQYAAYLNGPDNMSHYKRFAIIRGAQYYGFTGYKKQIAALEVLMGAKSLTSFGEAYAKASGRCYKCGRLLTDPVSVSLGIGPICRGA